MEPSPRDMNACKKTWVDRLAGSCDEVARLCSESLDRRLTPIERIRLKLHFYLCYFCRRYHAHLQCMHERLRRAEDKFGQDCGKCLCEEEKAKLKSACRKT